MSPSIKWFAALLVPAMLASPAQPADLPEHSTVKLLLLRQKSVQKELELGPEAVKKIMSFTDAQAETAKAVFGKEEPERKAEFEKLRAKNEKFLASDVLSAKQGKRLDQIAMQFMALHHLTDPEMAKTLKLTEAQVQKFKDLQAEAHKSLAEVLAGEDKAAKTALLKKHREETRSKILAILTEEQKTKVREMAGPPFEGEIVFEEWEK